MKEFLKRFKSWTLWVSLAGLIVFILKSFCMIDVSAQVSGLLDYLCPVLIALGIVNNPTDQQHI